MDHHLTIESDEAVRLADELSALTGESVEAAVVSALRWRLGKEREREAMIARVTEIAADIRAHMTPPLPTSNHDWLYDDETGLPK